MKSSKFFVYLSAVFIFFSYPIFAQNVEVDVSACDMIYKVLTAMKNGAGREEVSNMLDSILSTKPYKVMFLHYNRSWRPNHLPVPVFKRMIMSLGFEGEYTAGENQRADQMLAKWKIYYNDLQLYADNLRDLHTVDLTKLIKSSVEYAQSWLPSGWSVPDSYFFIHPNGGSNGFVIGNNQGYDFFQLPRDSSGHIMWQQLTGVVSHESHHLGMKDISTGTMSSQDSLAFEFLSIFVGEGTATKLVDNAPGGNVPAIDPSKGNRFNVEELALWKQYTQDEPGIFKHFITTFEKVYSGKLTRNELEAEIGKYWFTGLKGPAYFLGSEFFGAIYFAFGKDGCFTAIKDPEKILKLYSDAIKAKPGILKNCYVIPDTVVQHSLAIGTVK